MEIANERNIYLFIFSIYLYFCSIDNFTYKASSKQIVANKKQNDCFHYKFIQDDVISILRSKNIL